MRAIRREALDLGEDHPGVDGAEAFIVETQPGEGAGRHVLDYHIYAFDELGQQRLTLVFFEVAGDAAFVEVKV